MNYLEKKKKAMLNYVSGITPPLPSEYQQVEWIGSSGTQYINTNYNPSNNTNVEVDCEVLVGGNNLEIIGARSNSRYYEFLFNGIKSIYFQFGNATPPTQYNFLNTRIVLKYEDMKAYINDDLKYTFLSSNIFQITRPLYLFALNNGNAERFINAKLYSFKLTENGTTERDMIPCYRKSDNEVGMYDIVNDTFYTNAGTGTFTKGNDV